jgi:hypothetical protein
MNIPNILFYGNVNKNKSIKEFINKICKNDKELIESNIMTIRCAFDKIGIEYVRNEIKDFLKIKTNNSTKIVIFLNADYLTNDAQSALRRCIEIYNYNTLFIMTVENKHKLLDAIISRFSSIYIEYDTIIKKTLVKIPLNPDMDAMELANDLYNQGYSGLDLLELLKDKSNFIMMKKNIKNEKIRDLLKEKYIHKGLIYDFNDNVAVDKFNKSIEKIYTEEELKMIVDNVEILLICRRNSVGYIELIRGRYDINDQEYVNYLFS